MVMIHLQYAAGRSKQENINTALKTAIKAGKDRVVTLLLDLGGLKESPDNKDTLNEYWKLAVNHANRQEGMGGNSSLDIFLSYADRNGIPIPTELVFSNSTFRTAEIMMAKGYTPLGSRQRLFQNAVFAGSIKTMMMLLAQYPMLSQSHKGILQRYVIM